MAEPSEPLVTVVTRASRGDAEVDRAALDAFGIPAIVVADDEGGLSPGFFHDFGVRVVVRAVDAAAAAAILDGTPDPDASEPGATAPPSGDDRAGDADPVTDRDPAAGDR